MPFPAHIANNGCLSRDGDIALKPFQLYRTSMPDYGGERLQFLLRN